MRRSRLPPIQPPPPADRSQAPSPATPDEEEYDVPIEGIPGGPARRTSRAIPMVDDEEVVDLSDLGPADDRERLQAIEQVVQHARRIELEVALARPMESWRSRPAVLALLTIPLLALALHGHLTRAPWLFGPDPAAVTAVQRDAHLRFAMYLTGERLMWMRQFAGTLPRSLADYGDDWAGLQYQAFSDTAFVLRAARAAPDSGDAGADAGTMVLRSGDDARAFVGAAASYLRGLRAMPGAGDEAPADEAP